MYARLSVEDFTGCLADGKPTPGGGSAAALAGAMGAGLVAMFCNLAAGRKKYAAVETELAAVARAADKIRVELLALVDRDSAAYEEIVAANRLPRASEAEKAGRQAAIAAASLTATLTPLATASFCADLLAQMRALAAKGNPNALSDLKVGAELTAAAFAGARANVEINLPWLTEQQRASIGQDMLALAVRAEQALARVRAEIEQAQV